MVEKHPGHSYADDARLLAAEEYRDLGKADKETELLESFPAAYPDGDMSTEALWRLAFQGIRFGPSRSIAASSGDLCRTGSVERIHKGREPMEHLLPAPDSHDGFHHKDWVNKNTQRIAVSLGLPEDVGSHGLRGTNKTLSVMAGKSLELVSREAGHTSTRVTRDHYLAPGTLENVGNARTHAVLTARTPEDLGKIEISSFPKRNEETLH